MSEVDLVQAALAASLDELRQSVGADWADIETKLVVVLRRLESGEHGADIDQVFRLFDPYPAARQALQNAVEALRSGPTPQLPDGRGLKARGVGLKKDRYTAIPVFFATDRAPTGRRDPGVYFGSDRGALSFGVTTVSIPDDHRMGRLEKPRWWRLEFRSDPTRHVALLSLEPLELETFARRARNQIAAEASPTALVFVHGYNVRFADAARRTAQLAYDLHFQGLPILFSWPSVGTFEAYAVDETNVRWAETHFREFLRLCLTQLGLQMVHVVAHSMGNRLLAESFEVFDPSELPTGAARLREIVLTAPDIDAETFRQLSELWQARAGRCTLYASSEDKALKWSQKIHRYPRAGDSGPGVVIVEGMDTVDATAVDTSFLGHSYFGDNRSVITDLFILIRHGLGPDERGLQDVDSGGRRYWKFRA
jgi:esterase/lipase superfamily enzyme